MIRWSLHLVVLLSMAVLSACDVHEWPALPESVQLRLMLRYETGLTYWHHEYDGTEVKEIGPGMAYDNSLRQGTIRYTVRAFPAGAVQRSGTQCVKEFTFAGPVSEGYDREVTLTLPPGDYDIMVWSDLVNNGEAPRYDDSDFAAISLQGRYDGNDDYRDAFRGTVSVSLSADVTERLPESYEIAMQRPLAKYEFVANDVAEFLSREYARRSDEPVAEQGPETAQIKFEDYRVVFYYVGYMPDTYGMYVDKPVNSRTGVAFESTLSRLNEDEATMGFDYVLVNGKESLVTVRIGIYDTEGRLLSLTDPIDVPLKRNCHTLLKGRFLTTDAAGGIGINPTYNGDYNIEF